ncbi:MAG: DUF6788 family protein [Kiritimatiellia bacterium]
MNKETMSLREQRDALLAGMASLRDLLNGSLVRRYSTCSRKNCACHGGRRHGPRFYLAVTGDGGHGKEHLSNTLAALNILAFLAHTVLELAGRHGRDIQRTHPALCRTKALTRQNTAIRTAPLPNSRRANAELRASPVVTRRAPQRNPPASHPEQHRNASKTTVKRLSMLPNNNSLKTIHPPITPEIRIAGRIRFPLAHPGVA